MSDIRSEFDLKYVVLDCALRVWDQPSARKLFERLITLKLAGYSSMYSEVVVPFDKIDFYGTHVAICEDRDGELYPLTAMKLVSLSRSEEFKEEFQWLRVLSLASPGTQAAARSVCEGIRASGKDAFYASAWTTDPSLRGNRALVGVLKEMIIAYMILVTRTIGADHWFCFGTTASKTDAFFRGLGMTQVGELFHQVEQPSFAFMAEIYTQVALAMAEKHEVAFRNRTMIASGGVPLEKAA